MRKFLIFIVFFVFFDVFGARTELISDDLRTTIDTQSTESRENISSNVVISIDNEDTENDIQDKKLLKNDDTSTKSQSDFEYLHGYNLTTASFKYQSDEDDYEYYFNNNIFIPQGLTKDKKNNLLISMYDMRHCWYNFKLDCSYKYSIVVRYNPDDNEILNVYTFNNMNVGSHVGGLGYYSEEENDPELIFVSYGDGIKMFRIYENGAKTFIKYFNTYHTPSVLSTSHGYLWMARYSESSNNIYHEMSGYKIHAETPSDQSSVYLGMEDVTSGDIIPNYKLLMPKYYMQGLYCDSDPEIEDRLKFYFSASANVSYVYQAVLVTKDVYTDTNGDGIDDDNGQIDGTSEYYWESFYTPYGYNSGINRKLPDGGEGIVMRENKLFMLNEGASKYYCEEPLWDEEDIDCAREILEIDPIEYNSNDYQIFPSGSIYIYGDELQDYAYKAAIIIAQNKKGELYYSIGEFTCSFDGGSCRMFLGEPSSPIPVGAQYPYNDKRARVFVEDVKGIYFMNLSKYYGDTDDFKMTSIEVRFDDNEFLVGSKDLYIEEFAMSHYFGDDNNNLPTGDKTAMFLSFDIRWGTNDIGYSFFWNDSNSTQAVYQEVFPYLYSCYRYLGINDTARAQCRYETLEKMEDYLSSDSYWFEFFINYNINRFYNIDYVY